MANLLVLGVATANQAVQRLEDVLTARGHTVTLDTTANFIADAATTSAGQDAILVPDYDFDDSANLATALISVVTATKGCVVGRPNQQAMDWDDGDLSPNTLACRMGIIEVEEAHPDGTSVTGKWAVNSASGMVGAAFNPDFAVAMHDIDVSAASRTSRVPDDGIHVIRVAGTRELNDESGKPSCVTTPEGTSLVGHRDGSTEDGRMAWIGHQWLAASPWGHGGVSAWVQLAEWASGDADDDYPTTVQTSHVASIMFQSSGDLSSSLVSWTEVIPTGNSVAVEARFNSNGGAWTALTNGAVLPGSLITVGTALDDDVLEVRVRLTSDQADETPEVSALSIRVDGDTVPLTPSPTDHFEDGVLTWITGDNVGFPSQEVKSYNPSTRALVLFEPAKRTIQVGDQFQVVAGCKKRFAEDCVTKFSNGINFQGEPHLPGQDAILTFPDAN